MGKLKIKKYIISAFNKIKCFCLKFTGKTESTPILIDKYILSIFYDKNIDPAALLKIKVARPWWKFWLPKTVFLSKRLDDIVSKAEKNLPKNLVMFNGIVYSYTFQYGDIIFSEHSNPKPSMFSLANVMTKDGGWTLQKRIGQVPVDSITQAANYCKIKFLGKNLNDFKD